MDDALLVGVLDAGADHAKEPQASVDRQAVSVAVGGEAVAGHVLHGEVGVTLFGGVGLEDLGDVRVLEACHGLALGLETDPSFRVEEARTHDLEGDPALERLGLLGKEDAAHAAAAERLQDAVGADPLWDRCDLIVGPSLEGLGRRRLQTLVVISHLSSHSNSGGGGLEHRRAVGPELRAGVNGRSEQ